MWSNVSCVYLCWNTIVIIAVVSRLLLCVRVALFSRLSTAITTHLVHTVHIAIYVHPHEMLDRVVDFVPHASHGVVARRYYYSVRIFRTT